MTQKAKQDLVLVTGAAGFIAFHVIEALLRRGSPVLGLDNFDPFYDRALKETNVRDLQSVSRETGTPFEFREMDVCDLRPDFENSKSVTAIIHLGAKAGVRPSLSDPHGYLRANVTGTIQALEFARARRIENIVFGSSSSVYGDDTPVPFREDAKAAQPVSPYAATKRAAELFCNNYSHLYGIKVACLRFFTVYGDRQRPDLAIHKFTRQISRGEPITLFGDGGTERDYTYVTDIVGGVLGALAWLEGAPKGCFEIFNLGGSRTTPLKRLVHLIQAELGILPKIEWAPPQPGDVQRTCASVARAREFFNYAPAVPIEKGIALFVRWYKSFHPELFPAEGRAA